MQPFKVHKGIVAPLDRQQLLPVEVELEDRGGEVMVTDAVIEQIDTSEHLQFHNIGEVKLKGFDHPTALCRAQIGDEED